MSQHSPIRGTLSRSNIPYKGNDTTHEQTIIPLMRNALKSLRNRFGWTLEKAADEMGMSKGGYIKIERGENQLTSDTISRAAKVFHVSEAEVITGPSVIEVWGRVSAGGQIETAWEQQTEPLFEIEIPMSLNADVIGFEIAGDSMWPKYDSGDVIVVARHGEATETLFHSEAVVRTAEGHRYFKRIMPGRDGRIDLESYNAPPMRDIIVEWASGLMVAVPARRWRKMASKTKTNSPQPKAKVPREVE